MKIEDLHELSSTGHRKCIENTPQPHLSHINNNDNNNKNTNNNNNNSNTNNAHNLVLIRKDSNGNNKKEGFVQKIF